LVDYYAQHGLGMIIIHGIAIDKLVSMAEMLLAPKA
jgi:hypothetical protein